MSADTIALGIRLPQGGFLLDVDLQLPARGISAIFGPSGLAAVACTSLSRAFSPRMTLTRDGGTPAALAISLQSALLARPSTGGAATRARRTPSRNPSSSSPCPRGRSLTSIRASIPPD